MTFSGEDCSSVCTFDSDCEFPQVCTNDKCVRDPKVKWNCNGVVDSSGRVQMPYMRCRKLIINSKNALVLKSSVMLSGL